MDLNKKVFVKDFKKALREIMDQDLDEQLIKVHELNLKMISRWHFIERWKIKKQIWRIESTMENLTRIIDRNGCIENAPMWMVLDAILSVNIMKQAVIYTMIVREEDNEYEMGISREDALDDEESCAEGLLEEE